MKKQTIAILIMIVVSSLNIFAQKTKTYSVNHTFKQLALIPISENEKYYKAEIKTSQRKLKIGYVERKSNSKMRSGYEDIYKDDRNNYLKNELVIKGFKRSSTDAAINILIEIGMFNMVNKKHSGTKAGETKTTKFTFTLPFSMVVKKIDGTLLFKEEIYSKNQKHTITLNENTPGWIGSPYIFNAMIRKKTLDRAMNYARSYLNSNFATPLVTEEIEIISGKTKKHDYSDLDKAKDIFIKGVNALNKEGFSDKSKGSFSKSIEIWEDALSEADYKNKRARISKAIANGIALNVAYAYLFQNDFENARKAVVDLVMKNPKIPRKLEKAITSISNKVNDREKRFNANN